MPTLRLLRGLFIAAEVLLLAAVAAAAFLLSAPEEWHPAALVAVLAVLALVGERFSVELSDGALTASTVGDRARDGVARPAPAAACGVVAMMIRRARRRPRRHWMAQQPRQLCGVAIRRRAA